MENRWTDNLREVVGRLEREPLRNIVLLKHIEAFRDNVSAVQVSTEQGAGTLVLLDARASAYDQASHPEAALAALISSDEASLTRRLLSSVPARCNIVFKLCNDVDRDVVAEQLSIDRATSFLSFTADARAPFASDERVSISNSASNKALGLFEAQGHSREWLGPLLSSGRAFTCALEGDGEPRSACFAFESYRRIWEVGGAVTSMQHGGLGLASRVVRSALAELQRRSLIARYQVNEDNLPSLRLAASIGLRQFLQLTHFRTWSP